MGEVPRTDVEAGRAGRCLRRDAGGLTKSTRPPLHLPCVQPTEASSDLASHSEPVPKLGFGRRSSCESSSKICWTALGNYGVGVLTSVFELFMEGETVVKSQTLAHPSKARSSRARGSDRRDGLAAAWDSPAVASFDGPSAAGTGGRRESGYRSGGWEIPAKDSKQHGSGEPGGRSDRAEVAAKWRYGLPEPALYRIGAYRFMMARRTRWTVAAMARALGVSRQGYYAWRKGLTAAEVQAAGAAPAIGSALLDIGAVASAAEIERNLRRRGLKIGRAQVASAMQRVEISPVLDDGWRSSNGRVGRVPEVDRRKIVAASSGGPKRRW